MSAFQALVLGIVEGLTEFLPISSTGHLILAAKLLGLAQTEFQKSFEIVIQLGAIGAVVLLYWRQFLVPGVLARVLVAFLPTGAIGLAFYRLAKTYLLGNESVVLLALFLGGVILIAFEVLHREPDARSQTSNPSTTSRRSSSASFKLWRSYLAFRVPVPPLWVGLPWASTARQSWNFLSFSLCQR